MDDTSNSSVSMKESLALQNREAKQEEVEPSWKQGEAAPPLQSLASTGTEVGAKYSDLLKVESKARLAASAKIYFLELISSTEKALLVGFTNSEGKDLQFWFPKKLCANLNLESNYFFCWIPFLEGTASPVILEEFAEVHWDEI